MQGSGKSADPGIKIIRHELSGINEPDDSSLPFMVHVNLSPPDFMNVAFVMLYGGSEEIVARCADRAAVDRLLDSNELRTHPRLRWIRIKGPDGNVEEIGRKRAQQPIGATP